VKKAYPAYFGSYAEFGKVREWLDGFKNLYCIGRNGQHRYNNMDHSMLCGMAAVRALLGEADKSAVWNVNTEEEYHEKWDLWCDRMQAESIKKADIKMAPMDTKPVSTPKSLP
jgi:hypothetical protein